MKCGVKDSLGCSILLGHCSSLSLNERIAVISMSPPLHQICRCHCTSLLVERLHLFQPRHFSGLRTDIKIAPNQLNSDSKAYKLYHWNTHDSGDQNSTNFLLAWIYISSNDCNADNRFSLSMGDLPSSSHKNYIFISSPKEVQCLPLQQHG